MIDSEAFRALRMTDYFPKNELKFYEMASYMGYYWNGYCYVPFDVAMYYSVVNPSRDTELLDITLSLKTEEIARIWLNRIGIPIHEISIESLNTAFRAIGTETFNESFGKTRADSPEGWLYVIEGSGGVLHDVWLRRPYERRISKIKRWLRKIDFRNSDLLGALTIIQRIDNDISYMFHGEEYDFNYGEYKHIGPPDDE